MLVCSCLVIKNKVLIEEWLFEHSVVIGQFALFEYCMYDIKTCNCPTNSLRRHSLLIQYGPSVCHLQCTPLLSHMSTALYCKSNIYNQ
jgi:hypothetical protein